MLRRPGERYYDFAMSRSRRVASVSSAGPIRAPGLVACLVLVAALALPRSAHAWHASGHMQIALLAYDTLSEPAQRRLVELLRQHPRFQPDFLSRMPASLTSDAAKARWIFAYAATWPDVARDQPQFHHGMWHWVNLPLTLKDGQLSSCIEARKGFPASVQRVHALLAERAARTPGAPPPPPAPPANDPAQGSLLDALPRMLVKLHDETASAPERALALSWLLHLVGDAHQPLHAVALYTPRLFETGDRGGNEIVLRGRGSLHAVWDGVLGGDDPFAVVEQKAKQLAGASAELRRKARRSLGVERWLSEDCTLARSFVYVPAVLTAVRDFEASGREGKPELSLKDEYVAAATRVARERAVQAGARLAAWLEGVR
jgi:S1/P1 nuclease